METTTEHNVSNITNTPTLLKVQDTVSAILPLLGTVSVCITCGIATVANLVILCLFFTQRSLRTHVDYTFFNLAVADMLTSALAFLKYLPPHVFQTDGLLNQDLCFLHGLMLYMCSTVSLFLLFIISIDRIVLLTRHRSYRRLRNQWCLMCFLPIPWILIFIVLIIPQLSIFDNYRVTGNENIRLGMSLNCYPVFQHTFSMGMKMYETFFLVLMLFGLFMLNVVVFKVVGQKSNSLWTESIADVGLRHQVKNTDWAENESPENSLSMSTVMASVRGKGRSGQKATAASGRCWRAGFKDDRSHSESTRVAASLPFTASFSKRCFGTAFRSSTNNSGAPKSMGETPRSIRETPRSIGKISPSMGETSRNIRCFVNGESDNNVGTLESSINNVGGTGETLENTIGVLDNTGRISDSTGGQTKRIRGSIQASISSRSITADKCRSLSTVKKHQLEEVRIPRSRLLKPPQPVTMSSKANRVKPVNHIQAKKMKWTREKSASEAAQSGHETPMPSASGSRSSIVAMRASMDMKYLGWIIRSMGDPWDTQQQSTSMTDSQVLANSISFKRRRAFYWPRLLVLMLVVSMVCWVPYICLRLQEILCQRKPRAHLCNLVEFQTLFHTLVQGLVYLSSACNPFLCLAMHRKFRMAFIERLSHLSYMMTSMSRCTRHRPQSMRMRVPSLTVCPATGSTLY